MKPSIKINIVDWWKQDFSNNYFIKFLSRKYNVIRSDNPDFLLCSVFGNQHFKYDCVKIFYTGENFIPDFNLYDYAIGFDPIDFLSRYLWFPLFLTNRNLDLALQKHIFHNENKLLERGFCSFVVSNGRANKIRGDFFKALNKKYFVASGGRYKNNIGMPINDKMKFIGEYKFNIAFENSRSMGYVTEKIIEALAARTIPIYWGDPLLDKNISLTRKEWRGGGIDSLRSFFNPKSFVNLSDFGSIKECVDYIYYLNEDPQAYLQILREKSFSIDVKTHYEKQLEEFFDPILANPKLSKINHGQFKLTYIKQQKLAYGIIDSASNIPKPISTIIKKGPQALSFTTKKMKYLGKKFYSIVARIKNFLR